MGSEMRPTTPLSVADRKLASLLAGTRSCPCRPARAPSGPAFIVPRGGALFSVHFLLTIRTLVLKSHADQSTQRETSMPAITNHFLCTYNINPDKPEESWPHAGVAVTNLPAGSVAGWSRPMVSRPLRTAPLILVVALENAKTVLPTRAAVPARTPSTKYARPRPRALCTAADVTRQRHKVCTHAQHCSVA